ncbi:MAG: hypothetical protein Q9191_007406 [Dirinaria sp. TL-2023a]
MTRSSTRPLPDCNGPRLQPFEDPKATVDFKRLISDGNLTDSSAGGHAHVFEALIQSKTYALKIVRQWFFRSRHDFEVILTMLQYQFKFYDDSEICAALSDHQRKYFSSKLINGHMDPFFCECRAYGRLIDEKVYGKVAVRCYGYLMISAEREDELRERLGVTAWNRPREEYSKRASRRQPFRAIVKELVTENVPLTAKTAKKMLRDLRIIRSFKVYNMDICARNYKGGLLVDFSVAMTRPHYLFFIKPAWRREGYMYDDLRSFDYMLDEAGIATLARATRNEDYVGHLRPRNERGRVIKRK